MTARRRERPGPRRGLRSWASLLVLLVAVAAPLAGGRPASAQAGPGATPSASSGEAPSSIPEQPWLNVRGQELLDLDGAGGADALRIEGYWNAGRRIDTVTVYATEGDLPPVADYRTLGFDRTLWVFDPQSAGRATLIVRFAREGERSVAYLWDDQDGDGRVAYEVEGRRVTVTESPHWSMKVWTAGEWLRPDGRPTMDLHAVMDGCGDCGAVGADFPAAVARSMIVDGAPDLAFDMVDANDDGTPEWRTRRILTPLSDSAFALPFFFLNGNEGGVVPAQVEGYIFWPLLAPNDAPVEPSNYFDTAPFVPVDWRQGRIGLPSLVGYPIEHGYHVNSRAAVGPEDDPGHVNFENPMAYYDLAGDRDGYPELHVRFEYYGPRDPLLLRGQSDVPQIDVRYSWNQTNADGLFWDYKLNLHGRHAIDRTLRVGELNLGVVPHAEVPGWTLERAWDVATFVAVEREEGYSGSEGIYEWGITSPATRPYFAGLSPAGPEFEELPIGLRGEFRTTPGRAELYLDPVDGRLHLVGAEGGSWNLGEGRELRSLNLDGGETFDGWQVWDNGELTAQLYRVPGGLLYADAAGTLFREAAVPTEVLRTAPPADQAQWTALGDRLAAHRLDVAGDDLKGLFDRFPGPTVAIGAGGASDVRLLADGFRAVVTAAEPAARDALAALTGQPVGEGPQVVARAGGAWSVAPAEVALPAIEVRVEPPSATLQTPLRVEVAAAGAVDLGPAVVEVIATNPRGEEILVGERDLAFDAAGRYGFDALWAPTMRGDWRLTTSVRRAGLGPRGDRPATLSDRVDTVVVGPAPRLAPAAASTLGWGGGARSHALVALGFAGLAGVAAGVVLRAGRGRA